MKKKYLWAIITAILIVGIMIAGYLIFCRPKLTLPKVAEIVHEFASQQNLAITSEQIVENPSPETLLKIQLAIDPTVNEVGQFHLGDDLFVGAAGFLTEQDAQDFVDTIPTTDSYFFQKNNIAIQIMGPDWRLQHELAKCFPITDNDILELIGDLDRSSIDIDSIIYGTSKQRQKLSQKNGLNIKHSYVLILPNEQGAISMYAYAKCSPEEAGRKMNNPAVWTILTDRVAFTADNDEAFEKITAFLEDRDIDFVINKKSIDQ